MDTAALGALACPHCGKSLALEGSSLACESRHTFDIARQGYVNLLPATARSDTADTAEMIAARSRFMEAGHFASIADAASLALHRHLDEATPGIVADVGAGTGWLLARLLDASPLREGVALDVSKYAARRAASAHPRVISVVCNAWGTLPLLTGCAAAVVSFFAPRNPAEFLRVLHPCGVVLLITPQPGHLAELRGPLGLITVDDRKEERLERAFGDDFEVVETVQVEDALPLDIDSIRDLVAMGPSSRHTSPDALEESLAALTDIVCVTVAVDIRVLRRRRPAPSS